MKKLFCRLLGHTWVPKTDDPKIRWSTTKEMKELKATAAGEPRHYLECARCLKVIENPSSEVLRKVS